MCSIGVLSAPQVAQLMSNNIRAPLTVLGIALPPTDMPITVRAINSFTYVNIRSVHFKDLANFIDIFTVCLSVCLSRPEM